MKNYKELINEYQQLKSKLDTRTAYEIHEQRRKEYEPLTKSNFDEYKKLVAKHNEIDISQNNIKIYIKILTSNILYTIKEELTEKIIAVVNSYEGKKLGDKTKDKLNNDLTCINPDFCISVGSKAFYIRHKDYYYTFKIELNFTNDKNNGYNLFTLTDADNKVNKISADMLFSYDVNRYIDNIDEFITSQKDEAHQIALEYNELKKRVDQYNNKYAYGGKLFDDIQLNYKNMPYIK